MFGTFCATCTATNYSCWILEKQVIVDWKKTVNYVPKNNTRIDSYIAETKKCFKLHSETLNKFMIRPLQKFYVKNLILVT